MVDFETADSTEGSDANRRFPTPRLATLPRRDSTELLREAPMAKRKPSRIAVHPARSGRECASQRRCIAGADGGSVAAGGMESARRFGFDVPDGIGEGVSRV